MSAGPSDNTIEKISYDVGTLLREFGDWRESVKDRLDLIVRAQDVTNQHLQTLNGRVGRSEDRLVDLDSRLIKSEAQIAEFAVQSAFTKGMLAPVRAVVQNTTIRSLLLVVTGVVGAANLPAVVSTVVGLLGLG